MIDVTAVAISVDADSALVLGWIVDAGASSIFMGFTAGAASRRVGLAFSFSVVQPLAPFAAKRRWFPEQYSMAFEFGVEPLIEEELLSCRFRGEDLEERWFPVSLDPD